jgi:hypothetical protein
VVLLARAPRVGVLLTQVLPPSGALVETFIGGMERTLMD